MRALVLSGYGINCEDETLNAFKTAGINGDIIHVNDLIENPKKLKNFQILGSAHNLIEINRKIEQGCEIIFLAPLFKTKKSKNHLNISKFNILTLNKKVKFVALGGIKKNNISKTKMLNICGISGISMFQKKTGL